MNRKTLLLTLTLLSALAASATYPAGYYNALEGKKKEALKAAAKQAVSRHTTLQYYELPEYWQYSDVYPALVDGCRRWWEMYSDATYLIRQGEGGKASFSRNKMQREHAIPKSWWKLNGSVEYTPAYSDMWNLYPSDAAANQAKLNYPFGPVTPGKETFNNGVSKVGPPERGYGGGSQAVFEPADEYKGDFARAFFYMATVYDDINWVYHYMFDKQAYPTLNSWTVNMLLQWARTDKVSQKEIDRNNYVEQYQGNRNPFIDFPELAEYIWGVRTAETFYIADQNNPDPTPPITGDPQISRPANGESLDFGQTAVGQNVTRALQISGANLTEALSIRISGTDRAYFIPEITSIAPSSMNQNGGYLLNVFYRPATTGTHQAKLILYDGGLEGSIAVELRGEALEVPVFHALTALPATNISANGYTARWEKADGIADFYIIKRVRYREGNEESETYETGETSYTFTDRLPGVAESYTVSYSRLGITGGTSNSIFVSADSGVGALAEKTPLRVFAVPGGISVVRSEGEGGMLRVSDLSGLTIFTETDPRDGAFYPLAPGIYLVEVTGCRPVKICIAN